MLNTVKILSSEFDNLKRRVLKYLRLGRSDVQTSLETAPYGIDSNPVKDMIALYAQTGDKGKTVIVGYINRNQIANTGETRLYSTDASGNLKTYIWLKNDGTMLVGGDSDYMVRFSKLKEVADEMKQEINSLKDILKNWTPAANDGGAALKTASTSWANNALQKNIDAAKIDEIRTI